MTAGRFTMRPGRRGPEATHHDMSNGTADGAFLTMKRGLN